MKTIIAYLIVIVLGQFVLTFALILFSFVCGFAFFFLPVKVKSVIGSFVAGLLGTVTVVVFAYYIFIWLTGGFSIYSFGAAALGTIIPIYNDYIKYRQVALEIGEIDSEIAFVADEQKGMVWGRATSVVGEITGLLVAAWWVFFYASSA